MVKKHDDESYFFSEGIRADGAPGDLVAARGRCGGKQLWLPRDTRLIEGSRLSEEDSLYCSTSRSRYFLLSFDPRSSQWWGGEAMIETEIPGKYRRVTNKQEALEKRAENNEERRRHLRELDEAQAAEYRRMGVEV